MAAGQQQAQEHWRDRLIRRSEAISDAWEVVKAYAGRGAEWILFLCMFVNIVEMVPTISVWPWLANGTLIVQAITLDIAGFGLATMADYARRRGDDEAAERAEAMSRVLIGLMITSLVSVTIKVLWPAMAVYVSYADDALILARVVATVFYGHTMHALRSSATAQQAVEREEQEALQAQVRQLQNDLQAATRTANETQAKLQADLNAAQKAKADALAQLSQVEDSLRESLSAGISMQATLADMESSMKAKMQLSIEAMKAQMQAEMQADRARLQDEIRELKAVNASLKAQLKEQKTAPTKKADKPAPTKFDVRDFVSTCLEKNPQAKLSEIVEQAKGQGVELSEPTVSRYRKDWRKEHGESESESSAM